MEKPSSALTKFCPAGTSPRDSMAITVAASSRSMLSCWQRSRRPSNLESRLDNVVFRLGIAPTRAAARQLVGHKHIVVDGAVVNIPSFSVKPGMVVGVREKSKSLEVIEASLAGSTHSKYPWLEWDEQTKSGKFLHKPERADIPENIKEQLIVELYSK